MSQPYDETMLLLAMTFSVLLDPALCRQQSSGPARWQTDGRGTITVSTEARFVGEVVLRCKVRLPPEAGKFLVELDHSEISFQPAGSRDLGSGIVIEAGGPPMEILRVAGEDWIQTPPRSAPAQSHGRHAVVTIRLIDNSATVPVRADLTRLRLSAANP